MNYTVAKLASWPIHRTSPIFGGQSEDIIPACTMRLCAQSRKWVVNSLLDLKTGYHHHPMAEREHQQETRIFDENETKQQSHQNISIRDPIFRGNETIFHGFLQVGPHK